MRGASHEVAVRGLDCAPFLLPGLFSGNTLEGIVEPSFESLKTFTCLRAKIGEVDFVLARLDWSRAFGCEVFPLTSTNDLDRWDPIVDVGRPHGLPLAPFSSTHVVESGITTCCYGTSDDLNALERWRKNKVVFGKKWFAG